jgi:hydrocephalus-inducing protein
MLTESAVSDCSSLSTDQFNHTPPEGFLAPGQDVKLEVSFHPTAVNPDMRVEQLRCRLSGSAAAAALTVTSEGALAAASAGAGGAGAAAPAPLLQSIPDLVLTLTGACSASEAIGEPLAFRCNVRTATSKSLRLDNPSSTNWQLRPVISHEFWSGAEFVQVWLCMWCVCVCEKTTPLQLLAGIPPAPQARG